MQDPNNALEHLSYLVENFAQVATGLVIVIYLISLNFVIGLLHVVILIALFIMEIIRKRINKSYKTKTKKINDKTYSLVGEIIKSEKTLRRLALKKN